MVSSSLDAQLPHVHPPPRETSPLIRGQEREALPVSSILCLLCLSLLGPLICLFYGFHYRGHVWCGHKGGGGLAKAVPLDTWLIISGTLGLVATILVGAELLLYARRELRPFVYFAGALVGVQALRTMWLMIGAIMFLSECQGVKPMPVRYLMWAILIGELINTCNGERLRRQ